MPHGGAAQRPPAFRVVQVPFFFFFTLVTGPRRSLSLKLSDTKVQVPLLLWLSLSRAGALPSRYPSEACVGLTLVSERESLLNLGRRTVNLIPEVDEFLPQTRHSNFSENA